MYVVLLLAFSTLLSCVSSRSPLPQPPWAITSNEVDVDDPVFRKDYKYIPYAFGWMKFHVIPATWQEAQLRCQMEGAVLASPLNEERTSAMIQTMKGKTGYIFTGIHATFSKGDYFSLEGVPLSDISVTWGPYEPDNVDNNEDCLAMMNDGLMADVNCSDVMPFICFKDYKELDEEYEMSIECGTVDEEYKYYTETNSCYKFHKDPRTWSRAYMTCAAEGGYLAVINSEEEAKILSKIFFSVSTKSMKVIKNQLLAFIGFHDWGEQGNWRTIDGKSLDEAGYNRWGHTYETRSNTTEASTNEGKSCGSMYRNGDLKVLSCDHSISFICEKKSTLRRLLPRVIYDYRGPYVSAEGTLSGVN